MTPALSPDDVERRLRALPGSLELSKEDVRALDALLTIRVEPAPPGRRHRALRVAAALIMALFVLGAGNLVAAYYAPAYGQALAAAPVLRGIAQPLLNAFGLNDQNAVALDSTATSNGHTIRLVAGYADGLRTVLLLEIDGRGLSGNPKKYGLHPGDYGILLEDVTMTDQFGHAYRLNGGNGPTTLQFEPLVLPASKVGARLTLHVTGLQKQWLMSPNATNTTLAGDWILHATLIPAAVQNLPLPAPVRTTDGVYTVTRLRFTGTELQVQWTVSGPINDRFDQLAYSPIARSSATDAQMEQMERNYFRASLFDATGQPVFGVDSSGEWPKAAPFRGTINLTITHPGRYQLQLADVLTSPNQQIWVTVP
jgi:hypothetical protein